MSTIVRMGGTHIPLVPETKIFVSLGSKIFHIIRTETCVISGSGQPSPGPAWRSSWSTWDRSWRSLRGTPRRTVAADHRSQSRLRRGRCSVSETRSWSPTGAWLSEPFPTWSRGRASSGEQFGRRSSGQMVLGIQTRVLLGTSETPEHRSLKNKLFIVFSDKYFSNLDPNKA